MKKIALDLHHLAVESFDVGDGLAAAAPALDVGNAPMGGTELGCGTDEVRCDWSNHPNQYTCWYDPSCARGLCDS